MQSKKRMSIFDVAVIGLLIVTIIISSVVVMHILPLSSSIRDISEKLEALVPSPTEKATLTVGITVPVTGSITPIFALGGTGQEMIVTQIFEGLVDMAPGVMEMIPVLAKNTGETEDAVTWTYYLRQGIKFHDGTVFNASAVKEHFDNVLKLEVGTAYFLIGLLNRTEVVDEYTVRFVLNYPSNVFPKILSMCTCFVESFASVKKYGTEGINDHPIGTGPFKFVSQKIGVDVVLEANQDWWRLNPEIAGDAYVDQDEIKIDRLIVRRLGDPSTLRMALETGAVDVGMGRFYPGDYGDLFENPSLVAYDTSATAGLCYFVFEGNGTVFPTFQKKEMRQAFAHAIDYEGIIDVAFEGLASRVYSFFPPEYPEYKAVAKYHYDPDKALALIEEAGFEPPVEVSLWTAPDFFGAKVRDVSVLIKEKAVTAGFDVKIVEIDYGTFLEYRIGDIMEIHYRAFTADYPDCDCHITGFLDPSGGRRRRCLVGETDFREVIDRVDELCVLQSATPDLEKKKEYVYELQELWAEYLPELIIYREKTYSFTWKNVEGVVFSAVSPPDICFYSASKTT